MVKFLGMKKTLNIPSKIENLSLVEKTVDDISSKYNLNSELYGNVLIATIEAANNAILHGNQLDESKNVNIVFNLKNKFLTITIIDQGQGFDFNNIPDPTSPENIEKINGRGIFLMGRLADQLKFYDKGRKVELVFNL